MKRYKKSEIYWYRNVNKLLLLKKIVERKQLFSKKRKRIYYPYFLQKTEEYRRWKQNSHCHMLEQLLKEMAMPKNNILKFA
jgi:hypothetical protein